MFDLWYVQHVKRGCDFSTSLNERCQSLLNAIQMTVLTSSGALDHTTEWIKSSLEEVLFSMPTVEQPNGHGKAGKALPSPFLVFNSGFIRLLTWDYHKSPLPEVGWSVCVCVLVHRRFQNNDLLIQDIS